MQLGNCVTLRSPENLERSGNWSAAADCYIALLQNFFYLARQKLLSLEFSYIM